MKTAARPMVRGNDRRPGAPWVLPLVLLLLVAVAAMALYHVYRLMAVPRLQVCKQEPLVYDRLNSTHQVVKMNFTLCLK